jgi:hypothetical protein
LLGALEGLVDASVLKIVGQIAGIGGLALGVFLILFREVIRKNIFPKLPPQEAYRLLRLITVAVWSVAIVGILAWVYVGSSSAARVDVGAGAVGVGGDVTDSSITVGSPPDTPDEAAQSASPKP